MCGEYINHLLRTNRRSAKENILINHCESLVQPGTVVFLARESDLQESTWGVILPYNYWASKSQKKAIAAFTEYSLRRPQVPVLEFGETGGWRICFRQFSSDAMCLCPLEDFAEQGSLMPVPRTLFACTFRDGSRYYRMLKEALHFLAVASSRDYSKFSLQELRTQLNLSVGVQEALPHGQAIYNWKRLNLDQ